MLLFAHGIVGRADLPIPETLFGAAAAAVLLVSFVALVLGWSKPRLKQLREQRPLGFPLALEALRASSGSRCSGSSTRASPGQTARANLAPTTIFVLFWVGVPFACCCSATCSAFSPWRAVGPASGWVAARFAGLPAPLKYPSAFGRSPARSASLPSRSRTVLRGPTDPGTWRC